MEQVKTMDIKDLWRIVRKRKWLILIPAFLIFGILALTAYLLPAVYKSETLILIENQKIPLEYVQSTVTSQVEERLNVITQRTMSRTKLEEIIQKFELYPEYRAKWTQEEIIAKMREDTNLEILSTEGIDKSGRQAIFTVAFKLTYEGKDPRTVQAVTSELASLYIGGNLKVRVDASAMTTQFVSDELKKMKEEIQKIGATITEFKNQHVDELPEQLQVNMSNLDRYERFLETSYQDLKGARDSLVFLKGQLASVDPDAAMVSSFGQRVLSPKEQLEMDRTNLISLKARASENHPDLIALKERIAGLEEEVSSGGDLKVLRESLAGKETELSALLSQYTDKHPDVVRTRSEIADLEEKMAQLKASPQPEFAQNPTNPAYISLMTQIESKRLQIKSLEEREKEYRRLIEFYQQRIGNTPAVEKALATMQTDYDMARANYQELTYKETQAKISESLENRQQAERFVIIDPAQLPEEPYKPNRMAIVFIGLILGLGAGAGSGFLSEYMDQSFASVEDLRGFSNIPVLAAFPRVVTLREEKKKRKRRRIFVISSVVALVALLVVVQIYIFKFDILLAKVLRKAQKLPMP